MRLGSAAVDFRIGKERHHHLRIGGGAAVAVGAVGGVEGLEVELGDRVDHEPGEVVVVEPWLPTVRTAFARPCGQRGMALQAAQRTKSLIAKLTDARYVVQVDSRMGAGGLHWDVSSTRLQDVTEQSCVQTLSNGWRDIRQHAHPAGRHRLQDVWQPRDRQNAWLAANAGVGAAIE
jgi:hypothetical protein